MVTSICGRFPLLSKSIHHIERSRFVWSLSSWIRELKMWRSTKIKNVELYPVVVYAIIRKTEHGHFLLFLHLSIDMAYINVVMELRYFDRICIYCCNEIGHTNCSPPHFMLYYIADALRFTDTKFNFDLIHSVCVFIETIENMSTSTMWMFVENLQSLDMQICGRSSLYRKWKWGGEF